MTLLENEGKYIIPFITNICVHPLISHQRITCHKIYVIHDLHLAQFRNDKMNIYHSLVKFVEILQQIFTYKLLDSNT